MAKYWMPSQLKVLDEMPRNNMGKVNKKELLKTAFPQQ
jgi:non-ribosomal peptide synthetase component E (peptide arylation enzyme)